MLPVLDEQLNNKLQGNEVDEHMSDDSMDLCSEDDCMDLCSQDNHPNDLAARRSPQQSSYFQNENDLGSVGIVLLLTCSHLSSFDIMCCSISH